MWYLLFAISGASGLIYQVVWVRVFGNVFGNTIHSASLVVAIFMLGLGLGSYAIGAWADRRHAARPQSLLYAYGYAEIAIGLMGLGISTVLPHLGRLSALVTSYARDDGGWYSLSPASYLFHGALAILMLFPITLLMGGTMTLLVRRLVQRNTGMWRIAFLYAANTAGAAVGCFATDFALVPIAGLTAAQWTAVLLNVVAGTGALLLARRTPLGSDGGTRTRGPARGADARSAAAAHVQTRTVILTGMALALSGFAAMGMEIIWFRHFTLMLGGLRSVYSLLLTVILIGIGAGALAGGLLHRHTPHPARWLIITQGLFVVTTLFGLAFADVHVLANVAGAVERTLGEKSASGRWLVELWFNARPIVLEVGLPALLMGVAFPLANAVVQNTERFVARRAGVLYLSNTAGAVFGALAAGFLLLPWLGLQGASAALAIAACAATVPLYLAARSAVPERTVRDTGVALTAASLAAGLAISSWLMLPRDYLMSRALVRPTPAEGLITFSEGVNEVVAVAEDSKRRRWLLTNGHPMSSTGSVDQRYMRALAHIPLLCIGEPESVLVVGFGIGNTAHAATLHPSIRRVEIADLSRHVLAHSAYFVDANRDVLSDPRVAVYVNDGRQHLQMRPPATYDLITLEPPPIAHAGVAALYSRELYSLARTRLKAKGYISQWLPAYQVPPATTLSMIRAFVDVFPQAVLLSGGQPSLQLIGINDARIEIRPERLLSALAKAPEVQADLERWDMGSTYEVIGTFVGSPETLRLATRDVIPVSDDRPLQEYSVRSLLRTGPAGVPASVIDLTQIAAWCPGCFAGGKSVAAVEGLDEYLAVLGRAYMVPGPDINLAAPRTRQMIEKSTYLNEMLRNAATVRNDLGIRLVGEGRLDEAIDQFQEALVLHPRFTVARRNLTTALNVRSRSRPADAQPPSR